MTQKESILQSFRLAGGRMRLRDILTYPWGHEWNARKSDLRRDGYTVNYFKAKLASDNIYEIIAPDLNGQMRLA